MSLYDEVGGEAGLRAILQTLYDRLFDDLIVGFLFAGRDKAALVEHQLWFTAKFLGGPARYEGRTMPEAHASLPLLPGHFDRRHHLLRQVLAEHHVPDAVQAEWLRVDQALRVAVLKSGDDARQQAKRA